MTRNTRILMSVIYWAFIVYLFVPLALMVTMGFKDSKFIGFPIRSWTLDWYATVIQDTEVLSVFGYSMTIAIATTILSLIIGTWVAVFLGPNQFRGKAIVFGSGFKHSTEPGHGRAGKVHTFLSIEFGTDRDEFWPMMCLTTNEQSRVIARPDGALVLSSIGDNAVAAGAGPEVDGW